MVEYGVLVAHNASAVISLASSDVLSWASELNWARIGIAVMALVTLRMGFQVFRRR